MSHVRKYCWRKQNARSNHDDRNFGTSFSDSTAYSVRNSLISCHPQCYLIAHRTKKQFSITMWPHGAISRWQQQADSNRMRFFIIVLLSFFLPSNESNLRIHWVASVDFRHVPNVQCNDRAWTGIDFSQMRRSRNIKICVCHASFVSFERLMPLTCTWQNVR